MSAVLKYQCQYDTGLRSRKPKPSIYSLTKDGPGLSQRGRGLPGERSGLSWQVVGSWRGDKRGLLAFNLKRTQRDGRWQGETQEPAREAGDGHTWLFPLPPPPVPSPRSPGESGCAKPARKEPSGQSLSQAISTVPGRIWNTLVPIDG